MEQCPRCGLSDAIEEDIWYGERRKHCLHCGYVFPKGENR
jgi:RNA polymerase subunit RPABC4/transcription elongation factor Spt4